MRRLIVTAFALALGYYGWAVLGAWQIRQSVLANDQAALSEHVNWPKLRENLKPRIEQAIAEEANKYGSVGALARKAVGPSVTSKAVDTFVTPLWLSRVLRGREIAIGTLGIGSGNAPKNGSAQSPDADTVSDAMSPRHLRWAFFETPTRFLVEVVNPRLQGGRLVAKLALEGGQWKLVDVEIAKR